MTSLAFLFPKEDIEKHTKLRLYGGKVTLYKRPQSHQWQCRFKLDDGRWHQASTLTDDVDEAKTKALEIYKATKDKVGIGLSAMHKTFKQVAVEEMRASFNRSTTARSKRNVIDYKFILDKYLIPFFGKCEIGEITQEKIGEFEQWRISEMGKVPKASTQRHHSSAFNRVIKYARQKNYIHINKTVAQLEVRGEKGQPRPAFTSKELEAMYNYMPQWCKDVYRKHTENIRILCCAYVKILVNTGIRHSTESLPLRWKHLQWHYIEEKKFLRLWVSGKTGPRYLIAKNIVIEVLEELMLWQKLPYATLDDLIEAKLDKPIFVTPEGILTSLMENIFRSLMIKSNLLKDSSGQRRTLYSLRHTYATQSLASGVDIHTLARQMGTSVLMIERHYSKITPMLSAEKLA